MEQIVPEVNVGEKFILVTPPPGLFEVNAEEAGADRRGREPADDAEAGDNA